MRHHHLELDARDAQLARTVERLAAGDFAGAEVKKLAQGRYYRAKLNDADRLLFQIACYQGQRYLVLLEIIRQHAYDRARFLRGAVVDESRLVPVAGLPAIAEQDTEPLAYVNPARPVVHALNKLLCFDEAQAEVLALPLPVVLIGAAGSGKSVLALEKLKQLEGEILYVTLSSYLADHARDLYHGLGYVNDRQEVDFLSLQELLESVRAPQGRPVDFAEFGRWFTPHSYQGRIKSAHKLFEELAGVLIGGSTSGRPLDRGEYLELGVRRSVFTDDERPLVYELLERYLERLRRGDLYDVNLAAQQALAQVEPRYDAVIVDEVQDLTAVQLDLALGTLRRPGQFVLCGDSNQIVHPNFFSWTGVRDLFRARLGGSDRILSRVLCATYRNSAAVTALANQVLRIKSARFGSVDRESTYLIECATADPGSVELHRATPALVAELNRKTRRSARVAVLVAREEDKAEARALFETPLLFTVREAKGLEYPSVVLFNLVSSARAEFELLCQGVAADEIAGPLRYGRARDKSDRSLEVHKFHVNALFVAVTRAVQSVLVVEREVDHRLLDLLGLRQRGDSSGLGEHRSSPDEWRAEARRLEQQGKREQAEAIRSRVLEQAPVPWTVLAPTSLDELKAQALDPAHYNKKAKQLLFEYAVTYDVPHLLHALHALGFSRDGRAEAERATVALKYRQDYQGKSQPQLWTKIARHGVDFRNPLNQTPLMIAAELGRVELVQALLDAGADLAARDNWGRTPLQIALRRALGDAAFARAQIGELYRLLAPPHLKVRVQERLLKIDQSKAEYFLLNAMLARQQDLLRHKIERSLPAFETADFVQALEHFPDHVIPAYRKRRPYLSSLLGRNEACQEAGSHSRRLFARIRRGFYVLHPTLEVEVDGGWRNVYTLIGLDDLDAAHEGVRLLSFREALVRLRADLAPGGAATSAPAAAPSPRDPAIPIRVVASFERLGQGYPLAEVNLALARGPEVAPLLRATLDKVLERPAAVDPAATSHVYALLLLGWLRDTDAHAQVLRVARLPLRVLNRVVDPVLQGHLYWILGFTCGGDVAGLEALAGSTEAVLEARVAALRALQLLVAEGRRSRDDAVRFLDGVLPDTGRHDSGLLARAIVYLLAELRPVHTPPRLAQAIRRGQVDSRTWRPTLLVESEAQLRERLAARLKRELPRTVHHALDEVLSQRAAAMGQAGGDRPSSSQRAERTRSNAKRRRR